MEARVEEIIAPSTTVIDDDEEKQYLWSKAMALWGLDSDSIFPGSHPVAVDVSTAPLLKHDHYVVSLKADGVRHLLLLTMRRDGTTPIAVMIDRAHTFYEVCVWGNREYFEQGTLLDGELARDTQCSHLLFLVFDIVASSGVRYTDKPFSERLQAIHNVLFRPWKSIMDDSELEQHIVDENKITMRQLDTRNVSILPKPCAPFSHMCTMWDARNTSSFRSDGLVFTKRDAPMATGRTNRMLKWKQHHTVDVAIKPGSTEPLVRDRSDLVPLAGALQLPCILVENELLMSLANATQLSIIECTVEQKNKDFRLFPMRERTDKTVPNVISTVRNTIDAGKAALSLNDVVTHVARAESKRKSNFSDGRGGSDNTCDGGKRPATRRRRS
jgi:hypothetical protein